MTHSVVSSGSSWFYQVYKCVKLKSYLNGNEATTKRIRVVCLGGHKRADRE